MSADRNSFDRLVAGLSPDERGLLLKKLKANIEPEKESLEFEVPEDSSSIVDLKKELKTEPLLLRVWIYIILITVSLFLRLVEPGIPPGSMIIS